MTLSRALIKASAIVGVTAGAFALAQTGAFAIPHLTAEVAAPIYMNCPAFTKDGTSAKGRGWIEVQSFSWGATNASSIGSATGGAGAGKVTFREFTIKKTTDQASPLFFRAYHAGLRDKCTLDFDRQHTDAQQPYMIVHLENVLISSYSVSSGGDRPMESISFNFTKMETQNPVQQQMGTSGTGNNLKVIAHPSPSPSPSAPAKP